MWGNQGFDQNTGDHGGGYLNSQSENSQEKKKTRSTNVMATTVAHILKAEQVDDKFIVDDIELHQVIVVGVIRSCKESNTNLLYEIDDMTGPFLEVRLFVDNDENTPEAEKTPQIPINTYVNVCGHVRSFANKRNITAFKIRPITDMNEITAHILDVFYEHVKRNKPMKNSHIGAEVNENMGLTKQQSQVLNLLKHFPDEQGVTVVTVMSKLGLSKKMVEDAIEFLTNEGHVYSTFDEFHFTATDK